MVLIVSITPPSGDYNKKVLDFFTSTEHKDDSDFTSFSPKRNEPSKRHHSMSLISSKRVPAALTHLAEECSKIASSGVLSTLNHRQLTTFTTNYRHLRDLTLRNDLALKLANCFSTISTAIHFTEAGSDVNTAVLQAEKAYREITNHAISEAELYNEVLDFNKFGPLKHDLEIASIVIDILKTDNKEEMSRKMNDLTKKLDIVSFCTLVVAVMPFVTDPRIARELFGGNVEPETIQSLAMSILTMLAEQSGMKDTPEWAAFRAGLRDKAF